MKSMIVCLLVALCGHAFAAPATTAAPSECQSNGAHIPVGGQSQNDKNFFVCQQTDDGPKLAVQGCIVDGKQVKLGEEVEKADFVMVCNATVNNGARLMPSKCIKNGQQYSEGQTFTADTASYQCVRVGRERLAVKAAGCNVNGKELKDGDRITVDGVSKECRLEGGVASLFTVGCIQTDETGAQVERRFGCTWTEGPAPQQFEMSCDKVNDSAKKTMRRCNYQVQGGVHTIAPMCFRPVDGKFIGCKQDGETLSYATFNAESEATSAGFHAC